MANEKNTGDQSVIAFQTWFNKTYGMPTIATDGLMSNGTKDAYATHGADYIKYLETTNSKVQADLNTRLNDTTIELDSIKKKSFSKNKTYMFIGGALIFGVLIGKLISKK